MSRTTNTQVSGSAALLSHQPSDEEIRLRAFQIYEGRRGAPGDPAQDWEQARRELSEKALGIATRPHK